MRWMPLAQFVKKNAPSQALIRSVVNGSSNCYSCRRNYSLFRKKLWTPTEDIIYRKNLDVICQSHVFFYTVLNVDRYSHFLPYVTKSRITEKTEEQFKAFLQIENLFFKESYDSVIRFKVPTTVKVSSADTNLFNHLTTEWIIEDKTGCINVDFYISFRLRNMVYQNFMRMYIQEMGKKILYAFIREARMNSLRNIDVLFRHLLKR
ncbi:conserved Plasmodium protein, unknown function [Plasmodium knowlesi strain H]|uniref:Coenzyme Q-binding protein COQ10 START domain-containing protein n=3 Tax=Plasmodium knowlesi TaxID=5850 RepID=A0A5K1VLB7_PLAKH|nr:coenzyme Q-binding protein COQ10 homolog, mitochondrial, putative [Plasmodium knowlesi strain H]OTN68688.1 Uncharacterized protein PKNOH_S01019800 [Plasmodium knowlesi]CAA9986195.1 coenzyme Q-binding protein COQ10 homolog, mitochondrial, putative [Plasmodium knowlesi strain H]SBO25398.1 conserved Plasmodium protein, unknown function [Plasmodium knowlesi strain H]SBO27689.1 conserved Plasmodium protein, unknown function [Plasmodium knowlesi strain H]VVS75669.1 coenzyme Q-binding protein COQ1|eukprot:XP_002257605.1 hypothetical protein, conserved in Plasmodium species [Plasmodium knowlesi strain H]